MKATLEPATYRRYAAKSHFCKQLDATAAQTFRVGHATVERYLRRFRERGELRACKPPGFPSRVNVEQLEAVRKQLEGHNDLTLLEHCELWEKGTGMKLSDVTMHRMNNRLGISRKKRRSQLVNKTP